ncbi:nuclear mRNA export, poly(A)+RNA binding protein [Coemansia sp. RSA 2708]|nr:nuclear mRNA export, poly(A)+RNA binding protein [Coemansia sp. RSA 2708]
MSNQSFGRGGGRGRGRGQGGNRWNSNPVFSRLGAPNDQGGSANGGRGDGFQQSNSNVPFGGASMVGPSDGPVQVSIKGCRGKPEASLRKFLDTKVGRPVNLSNINFRGEIMYVSVPSMDIAQELLKLSGIRFYGEKLTFQIKTHPVKFGAGAPGRDGAGASDSVTVRDRLVALLQTRVDPQGSSLDLSALSQDSIIQSLGANPLQDSKLFEAILVLATQLYTDIVTVNLANNGMSSLRPVANLGMHFPHLRNLSLMNNRISDLRELNCLSAAGSKVPLGELSELILQGNPASDAELRLPNGGASYVEKVQQRFPTISMLDMNPVTPRAQPVSAAGTSTSASTVPRELPFPVAQTFAEDQAINELAVGFLEGFFGLYDGNRGGLADIYDAAAVFSLMVDTTHPTSEFARTNPDSQKRVDFTAYIRISRNLTRVKSQHKRIHALVVGRAAVIQAIAQLPATRHPLQDSQRFSFDAWRADVDGCAQQGMAVVAVHGEFTEVQTGSLISFDRVFALAPALPGSPAAAIGSPCVITNDQLTLRRYNGFHSWLPSSELAAPAPVLNLTPEQQEMARALQEQTGMNPEWTLKCLESYGWNYQQAMTEFPQVRGTLPAEAFQ